ncbi:hypothetical protein [Streptomyces nigra]|uniref:hypothetical protein n=1 Tax=Streptomyces nigra TaxID=1827580 RepID=UPI003682A6A3
MSVLLWLLISVPLGAGAVLGLGGRATDRSAPLLAVAAALATLGLAVAGAVTRPEASAPLFTGMRAGLAVDGLSAVMVVTVAAVALAVLAYSAGEFGRDENRGRLPSPRTSGFPTSPTAHRRPWPPTSPLCPRSAR